MGVGSRKPSLMAFITWWGKGGGWSGCLHSPQPTQVPGEHQYMEVGRGGRNGASQKQTGWDSFLEPGGQTASVQGLSAYFRGGRDSDPDLSQAPGSSHAVSPAASLPPLSGRRHLYKLPPSPRQACQTRGMWPTSRRFDMVDLEHSSPPCVCLAALLSFVSAEM